MFKKFLPVFFLFTACLESESDLDTPSPTPESTPSPTPYYVPENNGIITEYDVNWFCEGNKCSDDWDYIGWYDRTYDEITYCDRVMIIAYDQDYKDHPAYSFYNDCPITPVLKTYYYDDYLGKINWLACQERAYYPCK